MMIRPLAGVSWDELARVFGEAFGDYTVPTTMTAEALANMQRRRGYVGELSFGAYVGDRLIGFALTCLDGARAYNSGTGVVPAYRRGGVARVLVEAVIAAIPVDHYVLEVLEDNVKALALYTRVGFVETRRFQCWTATATATGSAPEFDGDAPGLDAIAASADVELSWQSSLAAIRRAPERHEVIGDRHGAAVVFPASADLALLAVPRADRRRGHGARVLAAAAARCTKPVRILNIDTRADGIAAFLAAVGARPLVRQVEMEWRR